MTFWCVVSQRASASPELLQTLQLESRYTHSSFQTFQERKIPRTRMEEATGTNSAPEFWDQSNTRSPASVILAHNGTKTCSHCSHCRSLLSTAVSLHYGEKITRWIEMLSPFWPSLSRRRCWCFWWLHFEIGHRHGGGWRLWMVSNEPPKLKPRKKENQMQYTQVWKTCWPQEIDDLRLVWSLEKVWNMLCWNAAFVRFIGPCSSFWHILAIQPLLKVYEGSLNLPKELQESSKSTVGVIWIWIYLPMGRLSPNASTSSTIKGPHQACCIRICLCSCRLKTFPTLRSEVPCQLPKVDPGSHFSFTFWEQLRSCR